MWIYIYMYIYMYKYNYKLHIRHILFPKNDHEMI